MGDLRSKLRAKISRRHSGVPPLPPSKHGDHSSNTNDNADFNVNSAADGIGDRNAEKATPAAHEQQDSHSRPPSGLPDGQLAPRLDADTQPHPEREIARAGDASPGAGRRGGLTSSASGQNLSSSRKALSIDTGPGNDRPLSTVSRPSSHDARSPADTGTHSLLPPTHAAPVKVADDTATRVSTDPPASPGPSSAPGRPSSSSSTHQEPVDPTSNSPGRPSKSAARPPAPPRRQSLLPRGQTTLIRTLLSPAQSDELDQAAPDQLLPISANMVTRKLWVKRPGGSATLVTISEEDLVDDVRELILRKYANSLGRQYDAPDITLRIVPREGQRQERVLGPEEPMTRTLDAYFPGGQTVDEALLIDVPHRRTPRASPRHGPPHAQHLTSVSYDEIRPLEASTDYFGPGAVAHIPVTIAGTHVGGPTHAISVLNTGQVPQIPSPSGAGRSRQYRDRSDRPRLARQHTSSPTILNVVGTGGHAATLAVAANHDQPNAGQSAPPAPPLPTPPTQEPAGAPIPRTATPPPRAASPRPQPATRPKKKKTIDAPALPAGMLNGGVPPINVLIVEDNIINLRLLEAFVKRLKVRWQTAMNGREAVNKWRGGGFHLVLMDIQLPVMSGLEATREIRRLERMNSIGAFSINTTTSNGADMEEPNSETPEEDKLQNRELFKSPVIIVALTASALQSDRHEALAAGCNDFLTKPVTYVWLERKVMEWGCMQALIDFDGWRKWKSYSQKAEGEDGAGKKTKAKKSRAAPNSSSSDGQ